jgi:hypothetical protein
MRKMPLALSIVVFHILLPGLAAQASHETPHTALQRREGTSGLHEISEEQAKKLISSENLSQQFADERWYCSGGKTKMVWEDFKGKLTAETRDAFVKNLGDLETQFSKILDLEKKSHLNLLDTLTRQFSVSPLHSDAERINLNYCQQLFEFKATCLFFAKRYLRALKKEEAPKSPCTLALVFARGGDKIIANKRRTLKHTTVLIKKGTRSLIYRQQEIFHSTTHKNTSDKLISQ